MSTNDATLRQAAHILKLIGDQKLDVPQVETLNTLLPALAQAVKCGKLTSSDLVRLRKAIGLGILSIVVPHIHLPGDAAFRVSDRFVVNTETDVPISCLSPNWVAEFGDMEVPASAACDLEVNELTERSLDEPIMSEIGDDVCETTPAVLWLMMKHGHLSKDKWHVFYMKNKAGVRRAVDVDWHDDGWDVRAYSTSYPSEWGAGGRVVSRKRLVA